MPWKKRPRYSLKFWGLVIALCVLAGVVSFGAARFVASLYSYFDRTYAPFDMQREEYEQSKKPGR